MTSTLTVTIQTSTKVPTPTMNGAIKMKPYG